MSWKRITAWASGIVVVFGLAIGTTYLCLEHFIYSRQATPGVFASHDWAHQIGLSAEQEKKLEPHEKALEKDLQALQLKLAQERMALCGLMHQGTTDSKELDQYITRVGTLEAEQQRRVVQHLLAMRDILTPEQKDKFFAAIMQGICQGCRTSLKSNKDMCGMCNIKKG